MQSVFYVQKSSDRNVPRPKRLIPKRLRPKRPDRNGQTESAKPVAYAENFHGGISFSGVWCHLYLVSVVCDVIIWRRIHFLQANVLAKFAQFSHSRQNKTIVLDKVNYRRTQSQTCIVDERSAKSGELVSGGRQ